MKILFVTSECAPWVKTGGLGDVSAALPRALQALGCELRVLMPAYPALRELLAHAKPAASIPARGTLPETRLLHCRTDDGIELLLLAATELYDRQGGPYQDATGKDWPDNARRFGALSQAAAHVAREGLDNGWQPQILHCHDWQSALAPAYARFDSSKVRSLITVHNLAFQGVFPANNLAELGLPPQSFAIEGLEYHNQISFLKAGLFYADAISTVSPTYAREIQHAALGFGLDGLLRARSHLLHGIVNGIDTEVWNPRTDPLIAATYDSRALTAKARNKEALQRHLGLSVDAKLPLFAAVSRMTEQKGSDLIAALTDRFPALPGQLAILGSGDAQLEQRLLAAQAKHPRAIAVRIGFDEALAHLIEAGADLFLMPSRFEPCGLNQMYSQRYGTPPIARATGGLVDTIVDCDEADLAQSSATGFLFRDASAEALWAAVQRALAIYRQPKLWRALQRQGMRTDFSWAASAKAYVEVYKNLLGPTL